MLIGILELQYNNFEIFRIRESLVPVETMEKKQQVAAFAWEPAGDRFAVVLGDVPRLEVTFYTMKVRPVSDVAHAPLNPGPEMCFIVIAMSCSLNCQRGHDYRAVLATLPMHLLTWDLKCAL